MRAVCQEADSQKGPATPFLTEVGMVVHACDPSTRRSEDGGSIKNLKSPWATQICNVSILHIFKGQEA